MPSKQCAFLSMDSLEGYVNDDALAEQALREEGWEVKAISWRNTHVDWNFFDIIVIRSTWDYHNEPEHFLEALETIDASNSRLENPLSIVRWNIDKGYLRDLEHRGVYTVPTCWGTNLTREEVFLHASHFPDKEYILKPVVSANAQDTYRFSDDTLASVVEELEHVFHNRAYMMQPFMPQIVEEGEFSLFFFNGCYSHTILKKPKASDFRVQEEHGGRITSFEPSTLLQQRASEALEAIGSTLLYARIDLVGDGKGDYALMELELIEPSLYFRTDRFAAIRFAKAFTKYVK